MGKYHFIVALLLPLSLCIFECWQWDGFQFMKSVTTHPKKEDTFIVNENVTEFLYICIQLTKLLSHMSRTQSVSIAKQPDEQSRLANKSTQWQWGSKFLSVLGALNHWVETAPKHATPVTLYFSLLNRTSNIVHANQTLLAAAPRWFQQSDYN